MMEIHDIYNITCGEGIELIYPCRILICQLVNPGRAVMNSRLGDA